MEEKKCINDMPVEVLTNMFDSDSRSYKNRLKGQLARNKLVVLQSLRVLQLNGGTT